MSNENQSEALFHTIFKVVFYVYLFTVVCAVPYYNWKYAQENGLIKWLILGEAVPTGKALIWPYFALHHTTTAEGTVEPLTQRQQDEMNETMFIKALNASQQASFILKTAPPGVPLEEIPDIEKAVNYRIQAVSLADGVDEAALNRLYPGLGTHFKTEFREAMNHFVLGLKNRSKEDIVMFSQLNDTWADWYNANRKGINQAFDAPLQ